MPEGTAKLIADSVTQTEIIHVNSGTAVCDGGDGALGHPRVFLNIPDKQVMCPYCSRLYVLDLGADHTIGYCGAAAG